MSRPIQCAGCGARYAVGLDRYAALATAACPVCGHENYVSRYVRIDVGLSEICNLSCLMCRRPQERQAMTLAQMERVIAEAALIGVLTMSFSGGEPFVHRDIRTILRRALDAGLQVEVVTNGTLVRESDIPLLERLKCVTVSIDGPASAHDFIRGRRGAWGRSMRTIEMLGHSTATWGTNTVIQRDNADVLLETWRGIREYGRPSYVGFTHVEVVPETAHLQISEAHLADAKEQVATVRRECARESIHFNDDRFVTEHFDVFADKRRRYRPLQGCPIPQTFLGITQFGFFPCWHQGRHVEADGLIEALTSPLCADIIREAVDRRCVGCNAANYSWSDEWTDGIVAAHAAGAYEEGVIHLSEEERRSGHVRPGKRTLPLLERDGAHA
jgi:MoaA/NifB/PqqE/SkfB family radical SAM enzyme